MADFHAIYQEQGRVEMLSLRAEDYQRAREQAQRLLAPECVLISVAEDDDDAN